MKTELSKIDDILITLLKMALQQSVYDNISWKSVSDKEWKMCYDLAVKHGVMAIAFDGIQLLDQSLQPSRSIRLSWALAVQKYEERYERYCRTASELSSFYSDNGIAMLQIKGVGLSSYYPIPAHREGGDIDIYTFSKDRSRLSDQEANSLADKLMEEKGIYVERANRKHSNFNFRNISIENHKTFIDIGTNQSAEPMNVLLLEILNPQQTSLCDGKYQILTPSPEFNALFLAFHAGQHFCSGLRLHHLFDYACMLKKFGLPLSDKVTDRKLLRFIHAMTALCNRLFGTDVKVPENPEMTDEVYEQIMHPLFSGNAPSNKFGIFLYKGGRMLYSHYKQSKIFSRSLWKVFWNSVIFHIKNPSTIFFVSSK